MYWVEYVLTASLLPVYKGPVYHDFHHAKFKGNYTGFLPYLDKYLAKTYIPAYLKYLKDKKEGLTPAEIEQSQNNNKVSKNWSFIDHHAEICRFWAGQYL